MKSAGPRAGRRFSLTNFDVRFHRKYRPERDKVESSSHEIRDRKACDPGNCHVRSLEESYLCLRIH